MIAATHKPNSNSNQQVPAAFAQNKAAIDVIEAARARAAAPSRAGAKGRRTVCRIPGSSPRTACAARAGPIA